MKADETRIVYGSKTSRPSADIAYERCETLTLLAESSVELSPQPLVDRFAERFGSDDIYMYHRRQDGVFVAHASRKDSPYTELLAQALNDASGQARSHLVSSKPFIVDYRACQLDSNVLKVVSELGYTCSVLIPAVFGDELFGAVRIMYSGSCPWDEDDLGYLGQVGRVLGSSARRIYRSEKEAELKVSSVQRTGFKSLPRRSSSAL